MSDWVGFEEALTILTEGMPKEMWADGRPASKARRALARGLARGQTIPSRSRHPVPTR